MIALFIWMSTAQAQTEVCAGPLRVEYWREAMDDVDTAIGEFNGGRATEILDATVYELRCLERPADPRDLGRLARQRSLMAFYQQDIAETEAWAILAAETIGGAPWPPGVPVPEPYHAFVAAMDPIETTEVDGKGLLVPKKGAVLLDGRVLTAPQASLGTTHLVQVADKKGRVLSTRWQHGAAFPDELLGAPIEVKQPKWYDAPPAPTPMPEPPTEDAIVDADPVPEPEPVPPPEPAPDVEVEPEPEPVAEVTPPTRRVAMLSDDERKKMFETREVREGCPWKKQPQKASATAGVVKINKRTYSVRSRSDQAAFKKVLRKCGEFRAARRFDQVARRSAKPLLQGGEVQAGHAQGDPDGREGPQEEEGELTRCGACGWRWSPVRTNPRSRGWC